MAYIDTEKLKRNIRVNLMPNVDDDGTVTVENAERWFLSLINNQPTADVVEVKHGEWVKEGCGLLVCNKCKFEYAHAGMPDEGLNYCPNCGAKMDGRRCK